MLRIKHLTLLLLVTFAINAQKTDTETKKLTIPVPKSKFFNEINKYNIIVESNDNWMVSHNHLPNETFQKDITLEKYKNDKKIDSINPDIKVIVGFNPSMNYTTDAQGQTSVKGVFSAIILNKNNEFIYSNSAPKTLALENGAKSSHEIIMANAICLLAYELLDNLLITKNEVELSFNYGVFEKCEEFPELVEFNTKTQELLTKLAALNFEDSYLDQMGEFYKGYSGKQFGKIKEKDLNKIIYLNLSLLEIFKVNLPKANEYLATAKESAGFLSLWPDNAKSNIQKLEFVNQDQFTNKIETVNAKTAYYITLKGTAYYKKKIFTGYFEIPRFRPLDSTGGMASLDSYTPNIRIYEGGKMTYNYPDTKKFNIKTEDGKDIYFLKYRGEGMIVEKNADGTYKPYESMSTDIYTSTDDENLQLKKV